MISIFANGYSRIVRAALVVLMGTMAGLAAVSLGGCDSIPQRADRLHDDLVDAGAASIQISTNGVWLAVYQLCHHARVSALQAVFVTDDQRTARDTMCSAMDAPPVDIAGP